MKTYTGIFTGLLLFVASCGVEQTTVNNLRGRWQISGIEGDTTLVQPDTTTQYLEFFDCSNAYTANCAYAYEVHFQNGQVRADTLKYTIKGDEFAIVTLNSTVTNFAKLWKSRRFIITEHTETNLTLRRYDDSLLVKAVKI